MIAKCKRCDNRFSRYWPETYDDPCSNCGCKEFLVWEINYPPYENGKYVPGYWVDRKTGKRVGEEQS